ncbi:MAG: MutS2/Smr-associated SH3 domain-containing protein [Planctomycetaceae bacterium]|nr:hypothetical protein [Planctomycetaceae bacterium]
MDAFTLDKIEFDKIRDILAGFCHCKLGRDVAAHIAPARSGDVIRLWLAQTSEMVAALRDYSPPPFGGITDIHPHLARVQDPSQSEAEDFSVVAATLEGAANVKTFLDSLPESFPHLREMGEKVETFDGEVKAIRAVIGPDGLVADSASPRLGEMRREIVAVTDEIYRVIHSYLHVPEVAKLLQDETVTLHGDRYVLPVKSENRGRLPGVIHRTSGSGATVFVEPLASVELNNRLADIRDDERREVRRLLGELSVRLTARGAAIASTLRTLAQVDLLSAKAQYAYQFDMTCPEVTDQGVLEFPQARHPLLVDQAWRQEQAGMRPIDRHPVVPIDVRLGRDFDLLVITGSNTGGKTVTLKTVALLVLMAQSGLHIPARRGATMPVFSNVFIDIGDEQSLEQSLSTFGAHMKRIHYVLSKADRFSLVLLDELGSGTDPDEGGAIGQAVLDELLRVGCLGVVTTHLSVLKAYAFNHDRADNASVAFDTRTMRPTYHLHIGTAGESHAIAVAQRLGLPHHLIDAARRHLSGQGKQFTQAMRTTGAARRSAEAARSDAQAAQLAAQVEKENFQTKLGQLRKLQDEFCAWLAGLMEMKPGDPLPVPDLNRPGKLVRLELHRQIAVVDSGSMQVEVPLQALMPDFGQEQQRQEIANLKGQIAAHAREASLATQQAKRVQAQYENELKQLQRRGKQYEDWLRSIAAVKVGDEVPIAREPGKGTLTAVDLANLKATVSTGQDQHEVRLQELFPQTGPFAAQPPRPRPQSAPPHPQQQHGRRPQEHQPRTPRPVDNRPMQRRTSDSNAARASREAILALEPGQQVYVVPFHKRATLVRFKQDKDQAVVSSGAFEMTVPLADLDLVRDGEGSQKN